MKGVSSKADDNYRYDEKKKTFTGIQNKFTCIYLSIWTKNQFTSRMTRSNEEMEMKIIFTLYIHCWCCWHCWADLLLALQTVIVTLCWVLYKIDIHCRVNNEKKRPTSLHSHLSVCKLHLSDMFVNAFYQEYIWFMGKGKLPFSS